MHRCRPHFVLCPPSARPPDLTRVYSLLKRAADSTRTPTPHLYNFLFFIPPSPSILCGAQQLSRMCALWSPNDATVLGRTHDKLLHPEPLDADRSSGMQSGGRAVRVLVCRLHDRTPIHPESCSGIKCRVELQHREWMEARQMGRHSIAGGAWQNTNTSLPRLAGRQLP